MREFDDLYGKLNKSQVETVMAMLKDVSNENYILEHAGLEVINGKQTLVIPLDFVLELLRTKDVMIHQFSTDNDKVRGLLHVRGEWIPIVHMKWCEHKNKLCDQPKCRHIVLLKDQDITFGLMVEEIIGLKESIEAHETIDLRHLYERTT
jgi:chemotaxis signal transduction protein